VDLLSCLVIARLAALLACASEDSAPNTRVYSVALWFAVLCPFTANYTAVPLTEVFASLWTALACCALVIAIRRVQKPGFLSKSTHLPLRKSMEYTALGAGWIVGAGTLFRPETPILLIAVAIVFWQIIFSARKFFGRWFWVCLAMAFGCLMILLPGRFETWLRWANHNSSLRKTQICRGTGALRLHGLGKDLALPRPRLLLGAVEAERRSHLCGGHSRARL